MIRKYIKLVLLTSIAISISSTGRTAASPKPEKCPSLAAIQSSGFDEVNFDAKSQDYAGVKHHTSYDTKDNWAFVMGFFKASSAEKAMSKALNSLTELSGDPTPRRYNEHLWMCQYKVGPSANAAIAFSPDPSDPLVLMRVLK